MSTEAPSEQRTFGFLDHAALWGVLGATLYVMPFSALLVPALSLGQAFLAAVAAAALGGLLVGAVAAMAARSGRSSVELLAQLLGERFKPLVAALLLMRNVVWAAFALSLIADSSELVSDRTLGMGIRPLWVLLFGAVGLALAAARPEFVTRKVMRRILVWIVLIIAAMLTYNAYAEFGIPAYLQRPAVGGWPSSWQAVDVMLIVPLLWLPLVADYSRFGRSVGTAFSGTAAGFFVGAAWFGALGVLYLPAVETADIAGFVQVGIADFVFVGLKVGILALFVLLILQTDEVFVNAHSAGVALEGVLPLGRRTALLIPGVAAIALAFPFDFLRFETSLLLLASVFVPLFGVLAADYLLTRGVSGAAVAPSALVAWALGFLLYHWIAPAEVGWWQDAMSWLFADALSLAFPLTDEFTWLGAAIPSFLFGFLLHAVGRAALSLRRAEPAAAPAR